MTRVGLDHPGRPKVLDEVSLRIPAGRVLVVEGRSGSGKSSLLALAAGLQAPSRGAVEVMGLPLDARDATRSAALRGQHVGIVFQHLHLLGDLCAADNIELPLRLRHVPRQQARARVAELLAQFSITGLAQQRPATLSGGEQQRVAIARALATQPGLLLVDEPTSSLDRANAMQVVDAIGRAAAAGTAVLVATHDALLRRAGRVVRLDEGRLESAGAIASGSSPGGTLAASAGSPAGGAGASAGSPAASPGTTAADPVGR